MFEFHAQDYDPPSIVLEPVVTNRFDAPIGIYNAGDGTGRLFILEKAGQIRVIRAGVVEAEPFLDLRDRVFWGWEGGLLGLTFPNGFATNRWFYVNYTRVPDSATVVSRIHLAANGSADPATEEVLLTIPGNGVHNGGDIAFGPDGFLYIAVGDRDIYPNSPAQISNSLQGKLLRIDVENGGTAYSIPITNPFVGNPDYAPEVWAMGLRNPWRFSFDRLDGDLWIGDVGGVGMEEVNFQPANSAGGQNYGWPFVEGSVQQIFRDDIEISKLTMPIAAWHRVHLQMKCGIGGYVCRNPAAGRFNGYYVAGDFITGAMFLIKKEGPNFRQTFAGFIRSVAAFGEDEEGNLYCTDNASNQICRLKDSFKAYPPFFDPPGDDFYFYNDVEVTLRSDNAGALIGYTLDGTEPNGSEPKLTNGSKILISRKTVLKARAYRNDLATSDTKTAQFNMSVFPPMVDGALFGTLWLTNGSLITFSTPTTNALIYYRTNSETIIPYTGPIQFTGRTISLTPWAERDGYDSGGAEFTTIRLALSPVVEIITERELTDGQKLIRLATEIPETIYYTLDGTPPTTNSAVYTTPFSAASNTTIRAVGIATNYRSSVNTIVQMDSIQYEPTVVSLAAGARIPGFRDGPRDLAQFNLPQGVCVDHDGALLVADTLNFRIRRISTNGIVSTLAGTGIRGAFDGQAGEAEFDQPTSVAVDAKGTIWVCEQNLDSIRFISNGVVSTLSNLFPGSASIWQADATPYGGVVFSWGIHGAAFRSASGNWSGGYTGTAWRGPIGVAPIDDRVGYVSVSPVESGFNAAIYISWYTYDIFAGGAPGFADGPRLNARFFRPLDLATDSTNGLVVSDWSRIRKIRNDGEVVTLAGFGGQGYRNGPGNVALFNQLAGITVAPNGDIFVADSGNNAIRKISLDTDADGSSDLDELAAGTDPYSASSILRIQSVDESGLDIQITWTTAAGKKYRIDSSSDLQNWTTIRQNLDGASATLPKTQDSQYFRIVVE